MKEILPEMITTLPEIEMPNDSIKGYLIQGESNQSIFFIVKAGTRCSSFFLLAEFIDIFRPVTLCSSI